MYILLIMLLYLISLWQGPSHKGVQSTSLNPVHPSGENREKEAIQLQLSSPNRLETIRYRTERKEKIEMTANFRLGTWGCRILSGWNIDICW